MTPKRPAVLPLVAVACAAVLLGSAPLGAAEQDAAAAQAWRREPRSVTAADDASGFHFRSARDSDLGDDVVQGEFALGPARFDYRFTSRDPGNETEVRFSLTFVNLVEYRDTDADGRFGLGDQIVQRVPIAGRTDGAAAVEPRSLPLGGGYTATVEYPLNETPDAAPIVPIGEEDLMARALRLSFHVLPTHQVIDGQPVPPTETKFDIAIDNFPYQANNSHVALQTRLASGHELTPTPGRVHAEAPPFTVAYTWESTAMIDGDPAPVPVTLTQDLGSADGDAAPPVTVIYSYGRGAAIRHDPALGADRTFAASLPDEIVGALLRGDWRLYGPALFLTALLVGGSAAWRLRRDA